METQEITKEDFELKKQCVILPAGTNVLDVAREDPFIFAKYFLGIELYVWQKKVTDSVKQGKRKIIICCARQMGKTTLEALLILWLLYFNKGNSGIYKNTKIGIISRSENQSRKIMSDIRSLIKIGDFHMEQTRGSQYKNFFSELIDNSQEAEQNKTTITIKSRGDTQINSSVKSFPPTDAILGFSLDYIFVDEASRVDEINTDVYDRAIVPTGVKNPNAMFFITSTPRGQFGFFYDLFDPYEKYPKHEYERFWYPIDAIQFDDPVQYQSAISNYETLKAKGNEVEARQEYYADFVVNETSFFNPKDIDAMFDNKLVDVMQYNKECDMGIDFGGKGTSHTVITISAKNDEGIIERLYHKRYDISGDGTIIEDVKALLKDFSVDNIIVDDCPAGNYVIAKMEADGLKITRMNYAADKVKKYGAFRENLHKGLVQSYNDTSLELEMRAMVIKSTLAHRTKIEAPKGYTDDLIDSFMMSAYYYIDEEKPIRFIDYDEI